MNILVVNENMKEEMNTPYSFEWKQSGIKAWIFFLAELLCFVNFWPDGLNRLTCTVVSLCFLV